MVPHCSQVWPLAHDCLINCPSPPNLSLETAKEAPETESAIPFKTDQRQIGYLRLRHRRGPDEPTTGGRPHFTSRSR